MITTIAGWIFIPVFIGLLGWLLWAGLIKDIVRVFRERKKSKDLQKQADNLTENIGKVEKVDPFTDNKFCSGCGKQLRSDDKFCGSCGRKIE